MEVEVSNSLQELVEYLAKALVDEMDAVEVREVEGEHAKVIELRVAQGDLGKVIGKQGRTARAMRSGAAFGKGPSELPSR